MKAVVFLIAVSGLLTGCGSERDSGEDLSRQTGAAEPGTTTDDAKAEVVVLARGAAISGANGIAFAPDGRLFIASVIGSELVVMDPDSGRILERRSDGVDGPDDIAFNSQGDYYWTSILTGEVAGMTANGTRITAARLTPGVNPLTFSDDDRLFVSQCFFDDKLYEVDPRGLTPARLIADDLGPGCGLNGMDWGPDGRLYGPRWFQQQVVSFDVDTGERRIEATGLEVPAAVKFDSRGVLHVLDTMAGAVVRIEDGRQTIVADLEPGLDNLAFDAADRLFVSSFADGAVWRIEADGTPRALAPSGMAHPGGVALLERARGNLVAVADLHALRGFSVEDGTPVFTQRNVLGVGALGSLTSLTADGANLILTSWTENSVRVWDPVAEKTLERHDNLRLPVSTVRYQGELVVAEHAAGEVRSMGTAGSTVYASGLSAPTALCTDGRSLWVSDRAEGRVLRIADDGRAIEPVVVAEGLAAPEGLALWRGRLLVREGESGRVLVLDSGNPRVLVTLGAGSPAASEAQPPSMIFNDIVIAGERLYAADELTRQLVRVDLSGVN
ncbi:MAG: hypothetical protein KDI31_01925 [Pseudomonadales bacterium]|nr:hypothetical protein [Pseudomonadales bacterium]